MKNTPKIFLGVLLIFLSSFVRADDQQIIDSLWGVTKNSTDIVDKAEAYVTLTEYLYVAYPDTVIPLCEIAIELIDSEYQDLEGLDSTLQNRILSIQSTAFNNIGYMYDTQGQVSSALDKYFLAIKIQEKMKDNRGLSSSYMNIGYLYKQQKDYESARQYYEKSYQCKIALKDTGGMGNYFLNLGGYFEDFQEFDSARYCYRQSYKFFEVVGFKLGIASALNNIGYTYKNGTNIDSAQFYYEKANIIFHEIKSQEGIGSTYNNLATIQYKKGNYKEAAELGEKALEIGREINFTENIIDAAHILEQTYVKTGRWEDAYMMEQLSNDLSDSLFNDRTKKASVQKELQYEYEKKEAVKEIEHQKEIELANAQKEKRNWVIGLVLLVLLAVGASLIVIYKRLLVTRRQRNLIEEQQYEILEKNEELNMQNEEIMAISERIEDQNKVLTRQNDDIVSSIRYAKKIQFAILPTKFYVKSLLQESFVLYQPKDIVSGDFYWVEDVGDKIYFAAVDCTGHGVPGAFMSIIGSNGLNHVIKELGVQEPAEILKDLTEYVIHRINKHLENEEGMVDSDKEYVRDGMDIALCALDRKTNKVTFAGAYNPLYLIREGELIQYKGVKRPIGYFKRRNIPDFEQHEIEVQSGDQLYIFSDGYADQFGGEEGKKFSYNRFRELLIQNRNLSMNEQKKELQKAHAVWKGSESQLDDICVMGVRIA